MAKTLIRSAVIAAFGTSIAVTATVASAASLSQTMQISATVNAACSSFTATPAAFGQTVIGVQADTTSLITVKCTVNTPYKILINAGLQPDGSGYRDMADSGNNHVPYEILSSLSPAAIWGDDAQTLNYPSVSGNGSGGDQAYTAFVRVFAGWTGAAGDTFSDTVGATLAF